MAPRYPGPRAPWVARRFFGLPLLLPLVYVTSCDTERAAFSESCAGRRIGNAPGAAWPVLALGAGGVWDVFDPTGLYLGELGAPHGVRLQTVVGETVYSFSFGEHDETWVVAYRLVVD